MERADAQPRAGAPLPPPPRWAAPSPAAPLPGHGARGLTPRLPPAHAPVPPPQLMVADSAINAVFARHCFTGVDPIGVGG